MLPDEKDRVGKLEDSVYGDRYSDDEKKRDGLRGRVENLEGAMNELKPLSPYLKLFVAAGKWLGPTGVLVIIGAVGWLLRVWLTDGGAP